jgi:hypothetical protein
MRSNAHRLPCLSVQRVQAQARRRVVSGTATGQTGENMAQNYGPSTTFADMYLYRWTARVTRHIPTALAANSP